MSRQQDKIRLFIFLFCSVLIVGATTVSGRHEVNLPDLNGENLSGLFKQNGKDIQLTQPVKTKKAEDNKTINAATLLQSAKLTANDGNASDVFGTSVAIWGNTAVVGAVGHDINLPEQGAVYVFVREGAGWRQQAKLISPDPVGRDSFGLSVAILGDTTVVGASTTHLSRTGAAYIFVRTGETWALQAKLTASDPVVSNNFGASVSISNDTVVVGAQGNNNHRGAAYVFTRSGTTWTQQAKLTANDGIDGDAFGGSVAISGETIVAGAQQHARRGAAYIFGRENDVWAQQAKLIASDGETGDEFGAFVAISGETIAITAEYDTVGTNLQQGSAYIFVLSGTTWMQQAKLIASDGAAFDYFGASVSLSGDTVVIGSIFDTIGTNFRQGSAYVFVRLGTTWTERQKLVANDGTEINTFGRSVAINGRTIIVGAPGSKVGINFAQGSAYVFSNRPALFDFDGDGRADVSVFRASNSGWYQLRSSNSSFFGAQFGISTDNIVPADFDGDGRTDIAVFRDGVWYWLGSSNGNFNAVHFGQSGDIPVPFDYTGDGRAELTVDSATLEKYVGQYQIAPNFVITVTNENGKLMTQATGQPKVEIFAESETKFFVKAFEAQITFVKDGQGNITNMILHQRGRDTSAQKIK